MSASIDSPVAVAPLLAEIAALRAKITQLQQLAETDVLTGLANRRALERDLARTILLCGRRRAEAAVALLDVDGFKQINDYHGHLAGDAALRHVAAHLRASFRESDIIGRWGGDEFLIILPDATASNAKERLSQVIHHLRATPLVGLNRRAPVEGISLSCGVARVRASDVPARIIARADAAMYQTKSMRRARLP